MTQHSKIRLWEIAFFTKQIARKGFIAEMYYVDQSKHENQR